MKKFFAKDSRFYIFLSLLILVLAQLPILIHVLHTPKDYYYPYLDMVSPSDYYYISLVRQGMGDGWLTKVPYVITEHKASLIQAPFIWLGKISKISGLGAAEAIALARIAGGIVLIISAILLIRKLLPGNLSKLVFVVFLFSQPLPSFKTTIWQEGYSLWVWHFGEAARRISLMPPHYTLGKGLAIVSLFFLFSYLNEAKLYKIIALALAAIFAGIIYPPPNFIISLSLFLSLIIFMAVNKFRLGNFRTNHLAGFSLYFISNLIPLIILKLELAKGYPWNMWNRVELGWNDPAMHFEGDYFRMFWLLFLLAPFFLIILMKTVRQKFTYLFIFIWGISAYLFFPFANLLNLGKFRFTEGVQILPLSIMAALVTERVFNYLKGEKYRVGTILKYFVAGSFLGYFLLFSSLVFKEEVFRFWPYWVNVYFSPADMSALKYLNLNIKKGGIILADFYPSNYLPAFAQVYTPLGFSDFYPKYSDYQLDMATAQNIMKNSTKEFEAKEFLKKLKVDFLYFEKNVYGDLNLYPNLLEKVYENEKIRIYQVIAS